MLGPGQGSFGAVQRSTVNTPSGAVQSPLICLASISRPNLEYGDAYNSALYWSCAVEGTFHFLNNFSSTPRSWTRGRGTYTRGTVNSVALLKVGWKSVYFPSHFWWPDAPYMHQIAQNCTYIFKNFSGVIPPNPQPPSPRLTRTVPLFHSFRGRCHEHLTINVVYIISV